MAGDPSGPQVIQTITLLVQQVGELNKLILVPDQTPASEAQGDLKYTQVKDLVLKNQSQLEQLVQTIKGDGSTRMSFGQIQSFVHEVTPKLQKLEQGVEDIGARTVQLENNFQNISNQAERVIKEGQVQIDRLLGDMRKELENMGDQLQEHGIKYDSLVTHAQTKFKETDDKQQEVIQLAKVRFEELETARTQGTGG